MKTHVFFLGLSLLFSGIQLTFSQWTQMGTDIDGVVANEWSGWHVSLSADGTIVAIGARQNNGGGNIRGEVRVYRFNGANWDQLGSDINGEDDNDYFGQSVSLSDDGTRIAIGANGNNGSGVNSGHVRIYEWNEAGETWIKLGGDINGEAALDQSGRFVRLSGDGNIVAIGAPENNGNGANSGHVRVYEYREVMDSWIWDKIGNDIDGEAAGDQSGFSVSINSDGSRVAIGAYLNDGSNGVTSGHVRIYEYHSSSNMWEQLESPENEIDGEAAGDETGYFVSMSNDGNRVAIGAIHNDGDTGNFNDNRGHVRVYEYQEIMPDDWDWIQLGGIVADIDGEAAEDNSGWSVSLSNDGNRVAIGAPMNDGNGNSSGHARVYEYDGADWNQVGFDLDGEAAEDQFGYSVSLSGDGSRLAVGAPYNDVHGNNSGHVRIFSDPDSDSSITSIGIGSGSNVTTGTGNTFLGNYSGFNTTEGGNNTFVGLQSGYNNSTGYENSSLGSLTLYANTTGARNTANGVYTLYGNVSGNENTAVGYAALGFNTTGNNNTATGYQSLLNSDSGMENIALGHQAGVANTTGNNNTYLGVRSGHANQTGSGNVFIGYEAGYNETGDNMLYIDNSDTASPLVWGNFEADSLRVNGRFGISNIPQDDALTQILVTDTNGNVNWRDVTTVGGGGADNLGNHQILEDLLPDSDNTHSLGAVGSAFSGVYGTVLYATDALHLGADEFLHRRNGNVALGDNALSDATVSGTNNIAIGTEALRDNTGGDNNTAVGEGALAANKGGNHNTALGYQALASNTGNMPGNGTGNVAVGYNTLIDNTEGNHNVAVGRNALQNNMTGNANVAIGYNSGPVGNAYNTVAIGSNIGINGDNAIAIGLSAAAGALNATAIGHGAVATGINSTAIGNGAIVNNDNQMTLGNAAITQINANVMGLTPFSDGRFKTNIQENVSGLEFINRLRPVSYQLQQEQIHQFLTGKNSPDNIQSKLSIGFIAQEVEAVIEEQGYVFTGLKRPKNDQDHYGLRYVEFVVPLTKAVQELSALVEVQQERVEVLEGLIGLNNAASSLPNDSAQDKNATIDGFALYQNVPNPFDKSATIEALVPESVQQAKIIVYNLQGMELESFLITGRGNTSIEISAGRFPSGMYLYALIADGQIVDTKKMILTR